MTSIASYNPTQPLHDPNVGGGAPIEQQPAPPQQPDPQPQPDPNATPTGVQPGQPTPQTAADARDAWANDAATTYRVNAIQSSVPSSDQGPWAPEWMQNGIEAVGNTSRAVAGNLADGAIGFVDGAISPVPIGPQFGNETAYNVGKLTGATAGLVGDASLVAEGISLSTGGTVISGTGAGALVGVPAVAGGAVLATAGVAGAAIHTQRFGEAAQDLLAIADPGNGGGKTLVVGGGRASDFPPLGPDDIGININPGAKPHVIADGNRMPVKDGSMANVVVENLRPQDFQGRGMLAESHRVLEPGGSLRVQTGGMMGSAERQAEVAGMVKELEAAGFRNVQVAKEYPPNGNPLGFRYVITATK